MRVCAGPRWALPRAVNTLSAVANLGRESSSPWAPTRASCHVPGVNDLRSATCRLPLASDASEPARCDPPWRPADSNAGHRRRALDCDNCPAIAELGRSAGRCEREPCNATARLRADWILSYGARICCVPVGLPSSINPASRRTFAGAVSALVRAVSQRIPYRWLGGRPARYSRRLRQAMLEYPPSVMTPVGDSIAAAFARAGAPGGAHLHFPWDTVLERLDTAAVQLGQTAPVQAAEYDRLRAEAEFRSGVIAPLGVLSLVILWPTHWSLLLAVSAGLLVLAWQAKSLRRETHELLATCLYLGYAKLPTLESLADELKRMTLPPKSSDGKWIGATVVALQRLGDWDLSDLTERKFLADSSNPDDTRDFVAYLKEYDAETAELAERLMERHSPRDSRAIMDELARASRTL